MEDRRSDGNIKKLKMNRISKSYPWEIEKKKSSKDLTQDLRDRSLLFTETKQNWSHWKDDCQEAIPKKWYARLRYAKLHVTGLKIGEQGLM